MKKESMVTACPIGSITCCGRLRTKAGERKYKYGDGQRGERRRKPKKTYKIAISQIVEHPSLDATRQGFLAALKEAGIEDGKNLKVDYNNAQGDPTNNLSIARKLASADNDLVLAIATPSAQAWYSR